MRENDHEIWIVDAHVVTKHRLRMKISRAGENGSPRMNHDRHAVCLSTLVNRRKAAIAVHVIVGRKHLMRGMHLDGSNSKFCKTIHFRARIRNRSWQHSAKRDKTIRRCAAILCTPVIHFRSETDNLWRDIVDQPGALYSQSVQKSEECFWIGAIAFNIGVVLAALFHQLVGGLFHHVIRHDVDMNVYDRLQGSPPLLRLASSLN